MIFYEIKTGETKIDDRVLGHGYSGNGIYLNDPASTAVKQHGPIPKGLWHLTNWEKKHGHLGEIVIHLVPDGQTETFGRSAFFIHGDNKKLDYTASDGCIILSRNIREELMQSGQTQLLVT